MIDTSALAPGWRRLVDPFFADAGGLQLAEFLAERAAAGAHILPPRPLRALEVTAFDDVRVVIVGQDPYHGVGQAHGLAFSVPDGVRLPPSLRNIYTEIAREFGAAPRSGNLESWARQGVLLVNAVLTVEEGQPASHAGRGWEILTTALLRALALDAKPKVFVLWGAPAQRNRELIERAPHRVLVSNHPSPLSARRPPLPFVGCGHFSAANAFLQETDQQPVDWTQSSPT